MHCYTCFSSFTVVTKGCTRGARTVFGYLYTKSISKQLTKFYFGYPHMYYWVMYLIVV